MTLYVEQSFPCQPQCCAACSARMHLHVCFADVGLAILYMTETKQRESRLGAAIKRDMMPCLLFQ